MGLRYRKTIKVIPGVKLNISKSGISTSVGKPGATVNFSKKGTRATVGIPGSGLSYSTMVGKSKSTSRQAATRRELKKTREKMKLHYGLSERQMRRFEKSVRRNPKKFARMTEDELITYAKRRRSSSPKSRTILIILFIFIIIGVITRNPNGNRNNTSSPRTISSTQASKESTKTTMPATTPIVTHTRAPENTGVPEVTHTPQIKSTELLTSPPKTEMTATDTLISDEILSDLQDQSETDPADSKMAESVLPMFDYLDASMLKGRGFVDIPGVEPNYVGSLGYAAVYTEEALEDNDEFFMTPWEVPVYQKKGDKWEQTGTIEHKTNIGVISQVLTRKNGKEYKGYLEIQNLDTGSVGYINVNHFVTTPYWNSSVPSAVESGYCLAIYRPVGKFAPVLSSGKKVALSEETIILLPPKGTYFVSTSDKVNYQIVGIAYIEQNNKKEKQFVFFNRDDLVIEY